MKQSSVRGTPVRHVSNTAREGMGAGKPKGYEGTVNKQFQGDQKINREEGISTGTPYQSREGNSAEAKRTVSQGRYGMVIGEAGDNQNPHVNGNGVLLDGMNRDRGYEPPSERTLDSPVPDGSPVFDAGFIQTENRAHLGKGIGVSDAQINDDVLGIGGVLSRGMRGTSTPGGGENELTDDDTLRGNTGSSRHEKE
jgi:hypothetical protein